jgi:trigger factor
MMVQVPEEQISAQVKEKLGELMRSVRIDGFRPGKAPLAVVQRTWSVSSPAVASQSKCQSTQMSAPGE